MSEWERGRSCCSLSNTRLSPVDFNVLALEYMEVVINKNMQCHVTSYSLLSRSPWYGSIFMEEF